MLDYTDEEPAPLTFNYDIEPNKEKYLIKENIIPDNDDKKIELICIGLFILQMKMKKKLKLYY